MSVRMVKICDESFVRPLFDIFQFSLETGNFPSNWKRGNRVWHEALIFKLSSYGISDSLLYLFNSFLSERLQRMVLNGRVSEWRKVLAGVPQGSILGPLLFLIFINDIPANLECNVKIFADDTSLFFSCP